MPIPRRLAAHFLLLGCAWHGPRQAAGNHLIPRSSGPCVRACDDHTGVTVVAAQCSEELAWLRREFRSVAVCAKLECVVATQPGSALGMEAPDARCSQHSAKGLEFASYLRFLVTRSGEVRETDWLAFVHGHQAAWHSGPSAGLAQLVRRAKRNASDFITLNVAPGAPLFVTDVDAAPLAQLWDREVAPHWGGKAFPCTAPRVVVAWCASYPTSSSPPPFVSRLLTLPPPFPSSCAQFLVSGRRVRPVPPAVWTNLLDVSLRSAQDDPHDALTAADAPFASWGDVRKLEYLLPILLGQPCVEPLVDAAAYERVFFEPHAPRPSGYWEHVGCYRDSDEHRVLALELRYKGGHVKTVAACQRLALEFGYLIMSMQMGEATWRVVVARVCVSAPASRALLASLFIRFSCCPSLPQHRSWACNDCDYWRLGKVRGGCPTAGGKERMQVFRFVKASASRTRTQQPGKKGAPSSSPLSIAGGGAAPLNATTSVAAAAATTGHVPASSVIPRGASLSPPPRASASATSSGWWAAGCFGDTPTRLLPTELFLDGGRVANTRQCLDLATEAGFNTAGLSNGGECWACNCAWKEATPHIIPILFLSPPLLF